MLVELLILLVVLVLGVAASVRVWRLRRTPQRLDPRSLPGQVPGPGDAGPLP